MTRGYIRRKKTRYTTKDIIINRYFFSQIVDKRDKIRGLKPLTYFLCFLNRQSFIFELISFNVYIPFPLEVFKIYLKIWCGARIT